MSYESDGSELLVNAIETLDSKVVYRNRWMSVREDIIRRPSGTVGLYGVVEKPNFAVILPVQDGSVHIVEQYRYAVGERCWELPQGAWEKDPGVDHSILAAGELREETGLVAGRIEHLGFQFLAPGFSSQGYHIYFATELSRASRMPDAEEEDLVTSSVSLEAFEAMILSGEIRDATTVNAYGLAKLRGVI